jgi:S1-C subfamily serine protease
MSVLRLLPLLFGLVVPVAAMASSLDYGARVVALSVTQQSFDERRPWAKTHARTRGGSAVVVEGPLLLTEAHMIADATLIRVEKHGAPYQVPARVVHVDAEIDLALLAVDEPGFFDDLEAARVAAFVPTRGSARTVRWRNRQLEVSDGRVTSIEVKGNRYGTIEHAFLLLTTDLTGGGWSEPVFGDDELIGLTVAQEGQIASVVPAEIIGAYLTRARNGQAYRGFASISAGWQNNRDPALSSYLGLEGRPRGVVITQIPWGSSACGVLEARDILLAVDGHPIDALGNYRHPRHGRLRFTHLAAAGHRPGDVVSVQVLREGKLLDLELELRRYPAQASLIPWRRDNVRSGQPTLPGAARPGARAAAHPDPLLRASVCLQPGLPRPGQSGGADGEWSRGRFDRRSGTGVPPAGRWLSHRRVLPQPRAGRGGARRAGLRGGHGRDPRVLRRAAGAAPGCAAPARARTRVP